MLADDTLAEDVCQDVLLRVWRALPGYRGEASVSTWIYAITRNTCLTRLQQNAAHLAVPLTQALVVAERPRAGLEIRDLIQRLPEKYRRVLVLFYFEDKSYQEVAALLDLPVGTVKTYLHRARKELAVALAPGGLEVSNGLRRV